MIRRSIRPHARSIFSITLLMLIAAVVPAPTARSQDRGVQERLNTLERELSMLQRQVYSSGPTPIVPPPQGSASAVDTELRMGRLEAQMRELTGRVEDAVNGVEQLRRRLEQINSDIEVRFNQGQPQARVSPSASRAAAGITDSTLTGPMAMESPMPGANPSPPRTSGTLTPPGTLVPPPDVPGAIGPFTQPAPTQAPSEATTAATGGSLRPPSTGALPSGSVSNQYNSAFSLVKQADYPAAEEALKAFVQQHPDHPLAGNAQYWLGETYYARHRYAEAASAFAEGYKRYPKGPKAADDLLKLGMSLARANQKQNACVALAQLDRDFPNPGSAIRDQAAREKKQLGC
jgi:tol-pal system protein YbgF